MECTLGVRDRNCLLDPAASGRILSRQTIDSLPKEEDRDATYDNNNHTGETYVLAVCDAGFH